MTDGKAGGQPKARSAAAIRQARYVARLKVARADAELAALESEPASDAVEPDPVAYRAGIDRARTILGYTYPIDRTGYDQRFTTGLVHEVARLLEARGYPPLQRGRDMSRLIEALAGFLYRPVQ